MGPQAVVIKGGHLKHPELSNDILFDGKVFHRLEGRRIKTKNIHGSGCTFAAAIAAYLARGLSTWESVSKAKEFVQMAIQNSYSLGHGNGPLGHFSHLSN
jgi:hydroxymethylpyrimidine/phosphomethylpyrimidine kinase